MICGLLFSLLATTPFAASFAQVPATPVDNPPQAEPAAPAAQAVTAESEEVRLLVGADASLRSPLQELAQAWADQQPTATLELELTNAGTLDNFLAKQRAYDILLIAGAEHADQLAEKGHLAPDSKKLVARDRLAVLGKVSKERQAEENWKNLIGNDWRRLAMGSPKLTASGQIADKVFQGLDLDEDESPLVRHVPIDRQAVQLLRGGEVDAIVGFQSVLGPVRQPGENLYLLSEEEQPPVFYAVAISNYAKTPAKAREFVDFLVSEEARGIWKKWGLAGD